MPPLLQQIRTFIQQFSTGQRIAVFTILIGVVSALIALALWANRPEYALLYSNLAPDDANTIVTALRDDGVPYRLGADGTTVYIPADQVSEYRLTFAAQGVATGSITGFELFDEQRMGMTTFMQRVNYQRALEGEITQTINQMDEVKMSRVHLVIPERKFFEEEDVSSASVVLHLESGAFLTPRQINGIAAMVANSVPDLRAQNVSIVDASGKLLSEVLREDEEISIGSQNWEVRRSVEEGLQKKVQELLDDVLGPGRSMVRVSADLNFEQRERTTEFYDTDEAAVLSEERNVEQYTGIDTSMRNIEQTVTNYELNKTFEHFVASSGEVRRLTVAVLVDGSYDIGTNEGGEQEATYIPRTPQEIERLETLVANALGINPERGDQVTVQNMQFDREDELAELASIRSVERRDMWNSILTNGAIAVALLISLVLLLRMLRSTTATISEAFALPPKQLGVLVGGPEEIEAVPGAAGALEARGEVEMITDEFLMKLSPEARAQLEAQDKMTQEVTKFVEENPEGAAQLLRIWTSGASGVPEEA
ncbi:MAG: flagellar M-ring protein FliF [Fidelibacterota bacterium]|nr:MAG: flagellar M-ring protein FliF [Candidatus Neomarinimicrobiota bacterium]